YGDVLDAGNGNSFQTSVDDFLDAVAGMPAFAPLIEPSSESTVRVFEATRADADRVTRALTKLGRIHSTTDVLRRLEHPFYRTWFAHDGKEGDGLLQCALGSLGQMAAASGDTDDGTVRDGVTALQRGGRYF